MEAWLGQMQDGVFVSAVAPPKTDALAIALFVLEDKELGFLEQRRQSEETAEAAAERVVRNHFYVSIDMAIFLTTER